MASLQASWISTARAVMQESSVNYFRVQPAKYWLDFLVSMTLAYGFASLYLMAPLGSPCSGCTALAR